MKLTINEVLQFLTQHYNKTIKSATPIGNGEWSQAFFFEENSKQKVIRFSATDEDFIKDKYAFRFSSSQLPVPKIEAVGKIGNGYFAISPKIEGEMIDHLNSQDMKKMLPALLALFDNLRKADVSSSFGYGGWDRECNGSKNSWRDFLENVTNIDSSSRIDWYHKLVSKTESYKVFNKVHQEMLKIIEFCPEERNLVHNDLLHFNLITNDYKIRGVIDWGCALYGDFLYDLAMYDLWQFYYPTMSGIDFKKETLAYYSNIDIVLPNFKERIKCYQLHLALDAIKYCVYKDNEKDLNLITKRVQEIL